MSRIKSHVTRGARVGVLAGGALAASTGVVGVPAHSAEAAPRTPVGLIIDYDLNDPIHNQPVGGVSRLLDAVRRNRRVMFGVRGDVSIAGAGAKLRAIAMSHPYALGTFSGQALEGGAQATAAQAETFAYFARVMRDETLGTTGTRSFNAAAGTFYFPYGQFSENATRLLYDLPGVHTVVTPDIVAGYGVTTAAQADRACAVVKDSARSGDVVQIDGQSPMAERLARCVQAAFTITGISSQYATNYTEAFRVGPNRFVS